MALALLMALAGCSQDESRKEQSQAEPAPKKAEKKITGPWVFGGLLLNNAPRAHTDPGPAHGAQLRDF